MEERVPMTVIGRQKLEEELKQLITVERPAVIAAIEHARSMGDLSENADYSAAKERQGFIEGRIQEISSKVARAEVIDPAQIQSTRVVFGARVVLLDVDSDRKVSYQIVGVDEADVKSGKIGITSPIARALLGKSAGDEVAVVAPKGSITYEILELQYSS